MNHKLLIAALLFFLTSLYLGFKYYDISQSKTALSKQLNQTIVQLEEADLELGRAKTSVKNLRNAWELAQKDFNEKIREEIKQRDAQIKLIARLRAELKATGSGPIILGEIIIKRDSSEYDNLSDGDLVLIKKDSAGVISFHVVQGLPFKFQDFRLTLTGDALQKTLDYNLHQRFRLRMIETLDKQNKISHYAEMEELDNEEKVVGKLAFTNFEVIRAPEPVKTNKFHWWNPTIDLQLMGQVDKQLEFKMGFDAGVSIMSYGPEVKEQPQRFRFVRVGLGSNSTGPTVGLSPVLINAGQPLPVINNLWLSPSLNYELNNKDWIIGIGIGAAL